MFEPQPNELDKLLDKANQTLFNSQASLKNLIDESTILDPLEDESTTVKARMLELLLQHRLDSQDALSMLLQIDHGLLQILGLAPQHSSIVNIERMQYALGSDDLRHILHALSQLVHSLLQVAQQYKKNLDKTAKHKKSLNQRPPKAQRGLSKCCVLLQKAVVEQKLFVLSITDINNHLDEWNKLAAIAPVLDHIAGLRGPVSQFFEAIQHGMELTHSLYETTYQDLQLDSKLDSVLQAAESVLKHMPVIHPPNHFFSPAKVNTPDQLEERASVKRLTPFFGH